jgi:hypothetical protein
VLLLNDTVKLTDGDRGNTEGKINAITSNDRVMSITADSRLGRLVIDTRADPVNDTFSNVLYYYLGLGGITTEIAVDTSLSSIPILAQGWEGDLWTKIKELLVTVGAEIALVRGTVQVRPVRERRALEINNVSESWSVQNIDLAQQVEIYYYNSEYKTNKMVYPQDGWNEDVPVYTVDAGKTLEVNIPVDISLVSLVQPTMFTSMPRYYTGPSSGYTVAGNDGLPIPVAMWTNNGGRLTVEIGEDGKSIDLTVVGATGDAARYAPYRIAVSAGPSDYYSSLRIQGTGLFYKQESIIVPTGVDEASTSRDVGVTVDNIFVKDIRQAWDVALDVTGKWSAPTRTINISKADINRPGETQQSFDYALFADFDQYADDESLLTFGDFDAEWPSPDTFGDFDQFWYDKVADTFEFQVFGNAVGARVQFRRAIYRIRSTTIAPDGVSYMAEADTTFEDFDESAGMNPGMDFADFDVLYDGLSFSDFALIPLPYVDDEYDR